jgi:hypothetical protein
MDFGSGILAAESEGGGGSEGDGEEERLGMQRFKLFTAWSYAVSRSKTITGPREQAV